MAIKFKGDMTKVVAKNKGDMTKTTLRKRVSSIISQILGGGGGGGSLTVLPDLYTKLLLHFDDSITSSIGGTIASVFAPMQGVASPDGTKVYMGAWGSGTTSNGLHVIDVATNTKTATISTPGTTIDHTVNSTGTRVYSAQYGTSSSNNGGTNVYVFDAVNNTLLATVPVGSAAHSVAITPDDKFVFVACETSGLYRIDTSTNSATNLSISTAKYAVEVSPDGTKLLFSNGSSVYVYSINATTGAVSLLSTLTGFSGAYTSTKNANYAYFLNNSAGTVIPVSWSTLTAETAITVGSGPYGACVSSDGKKLFVTNNTTGSVSVIDTTSNKVIDTITGYSSPRGVVFAGNKLFVCNNGASNVPVVDMRTFSDSALSPLAQSRVGTSVLASTTQSKFGGKSLALNGTNTNKLQFANPKGKAMDLSNKPFCVEGWFYLTGVDTNTYNTGLLTFANADNGDFQGAGIFLNASTRYFLAYFNTNGTSWDIGSPTISTTVAPNLNTWFHIALIRETTGGDVKLVYNGTVIGTKTTTASLYTGDYFYVGKTNYRNSTRIDGYVDDVRVVVGSCPYSSSAFVVPTAELTAITNTKVLIKGSTTIKDDSSLNLYTQALGSATSSTVQSKFGGSSIKIASATGDFIKVYNNTQPIAFLDRPFTIEGWFYRNSATTGTQPLLCFGTSADGQGPIVYFEISNQLGFSMSTSGVGWTNWTYNFTPTADAWHHFAVTREIKGGDIKLYCDGSLKGTISTTASLFTGENIWVGHYPYFNAGAKTLNGYMDEVRITLDQCKYNAAFTPPTAPFTLWGAETQPARRVALDSNDVLAWNFDETTGTYLNRGTAGPLNLYPKSGATVASAAGVFNNAVSFNATGGVISNTTSLGETSGDFSMSCWLKVNSFANNYECILQKWYFANDTNSNPWTSVFFNLGGATGAWNAGVTIGGTNRFVATTSGAGLLTAGAWAHLGLSYNSSTGLLSVYKNGSLLGTATGAAGSIAWNNSGRWLVGSNNSASPNPLNGMVDDVRVANVARDAAYFQSLYASGPNTTTYSFAANTLPGLKVWYKADAITGVSDGAALTSWIDSSGNGKNLSGYGATYQRLGINGRPSIKMEGGDLSVVNAGTPTGSSAITVYSVVTPRTAGEIWGVGDNNSGRIGLWRPGVQLGIEGMGKATAYLDAPSESPLILSFPYAQGTNLGNNPVYINGISSGLGSNNSPVNIGSANITLGHVPGYAGYYANSDIAEILIYNTTHTTAERQQVEAYLATKYGITVAT